MPDPEREVLEMAAALGGRLEIRGPETTPGGRPYFVSEIRARDGLRVSTATGGTRERACLNLLDCLGRGWTNPETPAPAASSAEELRLKLAVRGMSREYRF